MSTLTLTGPQLLGSRGLARAVRTVLPPSVAEGGGVVSGPLPHGRGADHRRVRDFLRLAEVAGVETDRTEPEFAPGLRELLPETLERRAVLADDSLQLAGQTEPDRVLGRPDLDLFAVLLRCGRDEEGHEHALAVLHPCREIDQNLAAACHLLPPLTESGSSDGRDCQPVAATARPLAAVRAATIAIAARGEAASAPKPAIRAPRMKPKSRQKR